MTTAGDGRHRDTAAALYEREHDRIHALCLAILRDRNDAEDAVQETFARVSARLATLDDDVTGYLVTVARNVCRDELRRRRRRDVGNEDATTAPARQPAVEDTAVERALFGVAWRALAQGDRRVLADVASGLSHAEIAARVGVSVDVAAQRISRARRRIRRIIAAPAMLALPLADRAIAAPLRRLGQAPANALAAFAGDAAQREPVTGPLLVAIIAGALAMPAPPGAGTALHPDSAAAANAAKPAAPAAARTAPPGAPTRLLAQIQPSAPPTQLPPPPPVATHNVSNGLEGVHTTAYTPSPDYAQDHTVFATTAPATCSTPCSALYRSDDGGSTWHGAGGDGLNGGAIALPPHYPADTHIYAVSPWTGVLRSDDGGAHFHAVLALGGGVAALDPTSPSGDARFFAAVQNRPPLLLYDDASASQQAVSSLPPDTQSISEVFTGPGASAVYVNLLTTTSGSALYACTAAGGCHRAGPALAAVPGMSPSFASDQTFFVAEPQAVVVRSVDGSSSLRLAVSGQPQLVLPAADYAASRRLDVVSFGGPPTAPLLASLFLVASGVEQRMHAAWTSLMDLSSATRLPDGHVLVALRPDPATHAGVYGTACSGDDGMSWQPRC